MALLILIGTTCPQTIAQTVVISEFMASNAVTLADEDGDFPDWIEIHNSSGVSVDLSGWRLTDSTAVLTKWTFPAILLSPDEYLVVFASGKDRTNPASELHTNFNLSKGGEYLGLILDDGTTILDEYAPQYPDQTADISYGRTGVVTGFYTSPTPGSSNGTPIPAQVADTKFSVDRGFYASPFQVEITTLTPGATIRFTTSGAPPTQTTGTVYMGPISITTTTMLRAAAFKTGFLPTNVDTQTYIFPAAVFSQSTNPPGFPATWGGGAASNVLTTGDYEMDPGITLDPTYTGRLMDALTTLPALSLVMDIDEWFSQETGIYSNGAREGIDWERVVSAELIFSDTTEGFQVDTGIRVQGGSSTNTNWKSPKLSLRLLFKGEYGPSVLNYPLFPDSSVERFNTLVLDARLNLVWIHPSSGQQIRGQYVRDQFVNDVQIAMGHLSPHGLIVHLFLNGAYWGIYTIHERPDDAFLAEYLDGEPEEFDVMRHTGSNVVAGSNNDFNQMIALSRAGLAGAAAYGAIKQYLDMVPYIDYLILNFWVGNTDWARHNWYVGRNRNDGSAFRFYSWDAEHVLKGVTDNRLGDNRADSPTEIFHDIIANPEFRLLFADRVQKHFFNDGVLTPSGAWELYERRIDEIDPGIILESARWGDHRRDPAYERDIEWIDELNRLRDTYFPVRTGIVLGQFRSFGIFPDLDAPIFRLNNVDQHGGIFLLGDTLEIENPNGTGTVYFTIEGSDPRVVGSGAIAASATAYSSPESLIDDTLVKARVFDGMEWSALAEATFTLDGPGAAVPHWVLY